MARNAFFVAMALGRERQAAGETLFGKSGLPELAPLLSKRSPVSPVASLHQWPSVEAEQSVSRDRRLETNQQIKTTS